MKLLLLTALLLASLPIRADDAASPAANPGVNPASSPAPTADATAPGAPIDPVKTAEIRKMIEETGALAAMDQMKGRMIDLFRTQHSSLPPEFWTRLSDEMDMNALLQKMIPVYDKYYTLDDLKAINAFYQSPAGKHMAEMRPQLTADSMEIGQAWGRDLGLRVITEIQKEQAKTSSSTDLPAASVPPPTPPPSTPPPAPEKYPSVGVQSAPRQKIAISFPAALPCAGRYV